LNTSPATGTKVDLFPGANQHDDIFSLQAAIMAKYKTSDAQLQEQAGNFAPVLRANTGEVSVCCV
jgi:hypothetical protein